MILLFVSSSERGIQPPGFLNLGVNKFIYIYIYIYMPSGIIRTNKVSGFRCVHQTNDVNELARRIMEYKPERVRIRGGPKLR